MANYRKLKVHEVGTDTYIDYEANVSDICLLFFFREKINRGIFLF
jgi:hypothetical protein